MKKIELKHIAPYLPYKLQWYREGFPTIEQTDFNTNADYQKKDLKPCLLPLSALTEPLPDGSVPIVELLKPNINIVPKYLRWVGNTILFGNILLLNVENLCLQQSQFEYLYANHFDIYNLIEAGLAIDKRTIKY